MRRSEFERAVDAEFGSSYGGSLVRDLVIGALADRTAAQALQDGEPPREVWSALAREAGVPESRRYGAGRLEPPRSD